MSNEKKEIASRIRDGSYFKDAHAWYALKYIYPITERSTMLIFALAALVAFIPIALLLKTMVQVNNKIPLPIMVADSAEHFSVIKPLAQREETTQEAVAKYLILDYIKSREEYSTNMNTEKSKKLIKKIKSLSIKSVLDEYMNYMNENNPYSPLVRYKNHTNLTIDIKSFSFLDNDKTSGKAKVTFEATEAQKTGESKKSLWEATINFRLPDVVIIAKTGAPLRFLVGYYRVRSLDSEKNISAEPPKEQNQNQEKQGQ